MKNSDIHKVMKILHQLASKWKVPVVGRVSGPPPDPFKVLISCILSLRTQDKTTNEAAKRLFRLADNPQSMLRLTPRQIEKAIYPVGFYRNKTRTILRISEQLVQKYNCRVPDKVNELLKFKGVGRKTANLVITLGYTKPGICVDTHVHRICNRWGYIKTLTPEKTEFALREKLPPQYWIEFNHLLVALGQNLCRPISPKCNLCPLKKFCDKVGV
ncbi:MAG: endonuclease III [Candidatus Aerophobetes bacterium]|nr:endonuclease III [Candidatus Aerophobetes bacterium]